MKRQKTQQSENIVEQSKTGKGRKRLLMSGLGLALIATAFGIIWLTNLAATSSSSRLSTSSEMAAQQEFQDKLITAQQEFQQKVEAAKKEAEEKSDVIGK